jgi:anti-sigma B factor antagonist
MAQGHDDLRGQDPAEGAAAAVNPASLETPMPAEGDALLIPCPEVDANGLTVAIEATDDLVTVLLSGDLDAATISQVEGAFEVLDEKIAPTVVVDLRCLKFIDSSGLRLLLLTDDRLRRTGRTLTLVPGPEAVLKVFRITALDQRLQFADRMVRPGDS